MPNTNSRGFLRNRAGQIRAVWKFGILVFAVGLIANPLVSARPILFVTRAQYINEHGTEATMYQRGEINTRCFRGGGALKKLDVATGKVTTVAPM